MSIRSDYKDMYQTFSVYFMKFELLWMSSFYGVSSMATIFQADWQMNVQMLWLMNGYSGRDG